MFGFDWEMNPFALASHVKSWQTSKDHMMDKVVMRDDWTWSDGKPITAHDVAFSFKLILSSAVPVPAMRTDTSEIRWVEAYDDHTLVYFHKQPAATNVWHLNFHVLPRHIYEKSVAEDPTLRSTAYHRELEKTPVTGGVYEIARWSRGQEVLLKRREGFYMHEGKQVREKPYFAQMRFRIIEDGNTRLLALKSGDIEESELEAEQWQTQTAGDDFYRENTKVSGPHWLYFYIGYNLDTKKVPFFGDLRVRQAMAYAMNYDEMLNDLCYGLYDQCTGIWNPDAWMYPKNPAEPYRLDLDKAEDLLDAAGWVDSDDDGVRDKEINGRRVPFEFSLMVSNKPDRIAICNLFRENLESIGVIANITPLEAAVFLERVFEKNFEAEFAGWGTGSDPSTIKNIFGTGEERNYGSYSNPEVDRLLREAMREFDRDKQAELYGQVHNLIYADQPYTFLYNKHSLYGFNKKLRGYRFSPRGPFHYSPGIDSIWTPQTRSGLSL
jgi:peptide/nickel transport system substrate-binding protein